MSNRWGPYSVNLPAQTSNNRILGFFNPVLSDLGRFRTIFRNSPDFHEISCFFSGNPRFFRPIPCILMGFGSSQEIRIEKSCQGMPSKSHLEPQGSKSVTKTRFLKVTNSGGIPGLACLACLACLAFLASHRPRSPCLHLATTARPPSTAGRRGAPLLLLLVQARRARPMRGGVSQARPGLVHTAHVFGD